MKLFNRIIYVITLIFSFQAPILADDIRDFQIEGMSLGDSLLDYYSEKEIESRNKNFYPASKKFHYITFSNPKFEMYEKILFHIKDNDKNYIIKGISGIFDYKKNINNCHKKKDEIVNELNQMFTKAKKKEYVSIYSEDKTGKSKANVVDYEFNDGEIRVYCINWSKKFEKEKNRKDNLQVSINDIEFMDWINNEAYK